MKHFWISVKAIITGYLLDVIGVMLTSMSLNVFVDEVKPAYTLTLNCLFILVGGFAASSVSQRYRLINAGAVGAIHVFWLSYMSRSLNLLFLLLFIPIALLGGYLSIKNKKTVGEAEHI